MTENESIHVWNKKQEDLTVGESVGIAVGVGVVMTLLPIAAYAGVAVVQQLAERHRIKKAQKLGLKVELVDD